MIDVSKTLPRGLIRCETCGDHTPTTGTRRCDRCWEVESRLPAYVRTEKGKLFVCRVLDGQEEAAARVVGKVDIDTLAVAARGLVVVLEAAEVGLFTWVQSVHQRIAALRALLARADEAGIQMKGEAR